MTKGNGVIEVIAGPMFSGKTEELIRRVRRLGYANIKTLVIKPKTDDRWSEQRIISRAGSSIDTKVFDNAVAVKDAFESGDYEALVIDEVQFFNEDIIDVIKWIASRGHNVIMSGLDMDFNGKGFRIMPELLAIADKVYKVSAICNVCHNDATMSFRKIASQEQVLVGDEEYEPRCRVCHAKGIKKNAQ